MDCADPRYCNERSNDRIDHKRRRETEERSRLGQALALAFDIRRRPPQCFPEPCANKSCEQGSASSLVSRTPSEGVAEPDPGSGGLDQEKKVLHVRLVWLLCASVLCNTVCTRWDDLRVDNASLPASRSQVIPCIGNQSFHCIALC